MIASRIPPRSELPRCAAPAFTTAIRMCAFAFVAAAALNQTTVAADWPPFQQVRANEDYSSATDPQVRATLPAPYKFLPLAADGSAWLSFGGQLRERYDVFDSPRFGIGSKSDAYDLQRLLLHADAHIGAHFRVFVEIGRHDAFSKRTALLASDKDPTDIQNAFFDMSSNAAQQWRLRVGRQELLLNATQRFIGIRDGPNMRQSFDGARLSWSNSLWKVDAFTLRPVLAKPDAFDDRGDPSTRFSGLYASRRLARVDGSTDIYWFALDRWSAKYGTRIANERRRSVGARIMLKSTAWDIDGDAAFQNGTFGSADIRAWGVGLSVGRTFRAPWQPRMGLRFDAASGGSLRDARRIRTFNPLFPRGSYFDETALTTYSNLLAIRPSLTLTPVQAVTLELSEAWRWRASRLDVLYLSPFTSLPSSGNDSASYVGAWTVFDVGWRPNRWLTLRAEFAHVDAGPAVTLGGGHDVNFEMINAQLRF